MADFRSILLAEDNAEDVELTLEALSRHNLANKVIVARDGSETLDYLYCRGKFKSRPPEPPAVVLLDIKMPKVNGLQVLKTIKMDDHLKTIPVVMLTSSREEPDLAASYKLGVNGYVVKPVGFQEFIKAVSELGIFWAILNEPPPGSVRKAI
ncbi:MAG: response regulator [Nitrospirae bacterium]|nr:response regulator [Candidatus Manganitrophaceae bacterium]